MSSNYASGQLPDIHTPFLRFNREYFHGKLEPISLQWCKDMPPMVDGSFRRRYWNQPGAIYLNPWRLAHLPMEEIEKFLIHMMIHTYLDYCSKTDSFDIHGPNFLDEVYRLREEHGMDVPPYCPLR